jgi:16S rRNA (cytosine1402-N4)-methyltransferase
MSEAPGIYHWPVMVSEALESLGVHPGGTYIDCTLGDGGHAVAILEAAHAAPSASRPHGRLLGIDADPEATQAATARLARFGDAAVIVNVNFDHLENTATAEGVVPVDGVLFDLGLSSRQLDIEERGFSFRRPGALDMRFSEAGEPTADQIVNEWTQEDLADVIYQFGEERRSRRIARGIVNNRPIHDAQVLAEVVRRASGYPRGRTHAATRTFQALRIAVNQEIERLRAGLEQAVRVLRLGGRLVTIAYHSLEDREIKRFIAASGDVLHAVHKRVLKPTKDEVERNPRSRSAKLRVAERIDPGPEAGARCNG